MVRHRLKAKISQRTVVEKYLFIHVPSILKWKMKPFGTKEDLNNPFVLGLRRSTEVTLIVKGDSYQENYLANMNSTPVSDFKVFHDAVHGTIRIDPLLVAIIDTPQYQRLRDIKQLGTSYWVFPGATHNRFEHGIGTSYLCGLMLSTLREHCKDEYQCDSMITNKDILCVQIAGLLHDVGHGPFSHFFENYITRLDPESTWRHEDMSCSMFDYLLESNPKVKELFQSYGMGEEEIGLIKRMIRGKNPHKDKISETTMYRGELFEKWFLYEIVSNKRTGIDCDKFDYLARDAHHVGINNSFDFLRFFKNIRILGVNGQLQICVRDKEVLNLYELFHLRWMLHQNVYQHKTGKIIDDLVFLALSKVDKKFGISDSITDVKRYTWMTDSLIFEILRSRDNDPAILAAQSILKRLQTREFYKFCGQVNTHKKDVVPHSPEEINVDEISEEIVSRHDCLTTDDIYVNLTHIGIGMKGKDPIAELIFFAKSGNVLQLKSNSISEMLPKIFEEEYIRVYCKSPNKAKIMEEAFTDWCQEKGYTSHGGFNLLKKGFSSISINEENG